MSHRSGVWDKAGTKGFASDGIGHTVGKASSDTERSKSSVSTPPFVADVIDQGENDRLEGGVFAPPFVTDAIDQVKNDRPEGGVFAPPFAADAIGQGNNDRPEGGVFAPPFVADAIRKVSRRKCGVFASCFATNSAGKAIHRRE